MRNFKNYEIRTNRAGKTTLLDRLTTAYLKGEKEDLSDEDEIVLSRWKLVQALSMQHRPCVSSADICRALVSQFGISEPTAYKDIAQAQQLFGNINQTNREFKRSVYVEWLEQLASLAEVKGDMKSAVAALKEAAAIRGLYEKDNSDDKKGNRSYHLNMFFGEGDEIKRKTIDLDKVNEIAATEFAQIIQAVDRPRVDIETMETMLDKHHDDRE